MASKENADGKKGGSDQSWSIPTADPNNLLYKDGDGIERSIYLPQGTMHQAWDHLVNERWDELAKYEPYGEFSVTIRSMVPEYVCLPSILSVHLFNIKV
jgi:hypothetical protein